MKARDRATIEAARLKALAEMAALNEREIEIKREEDEVRRQILRLRDSATFPEELMDCDKVVVEANDRDDYVIISLTRGQAIVRRYGSGAFGERTTIRAGSKYAPVSLEQCRAAWVAAGRGLP